MAEEQSTKRGRNFKDLTGQIFGRLTVLSFAGILKYRAAFWRCRCECGNETVVRSQKLCDGVQLSCGCLGKQRLAEYRLSHGMWGSKEYWAWALAKNRCNNPKNRGYKNYGGRGIRMSAAWSDSFEQFYKDMGPCPPGMSLDRINNDGHYEHGNCRWTTQTAQMRNTRATAKITHAGLTLSFAEWAEITGISVNTLRARHYLKWKPPDLFKPARKHH